MPCSTGQVGVAKVNAFGGGGGILFALGAEVATFTDTSTQSAHIDGSVTQAAAVTIDAEDVETVGGLLAHQLGKVPIAGSVASVAGLRLTAENLTGRRNRIGTVMVERISPAGHQFSASAEGQHDAGAPAAADGASRSESAVANGSGPAS